MKPKGEVRPTRHRDRLLLDFAALLRDRAIPLGLIAAGDAPRIWERHIWDSLRGAACIRQGDSVMVDVGTGAGLPGIPLAIVFHDRRFLLIEQQRRRVAFLEMAVERLDLRNVQVVQASAPLPNLDADVATARALAGPGRAWELGFPSLRPGGKLLYYAGASWKQADAEALRSLGTSVDVCSDGLPPDQGPILALRKAT